ncbi:MAG: helix-turn-helix domain-containing protein [Nitriliruptoraceae bacterium]
MAPAGTGPDGPDHGITCHLDELLAARGMTLKELSERVGVTVVNLSVLKNDRAKAVRFSTLSALCAALECQPGDLFGHRGPAGTNSP